MGAADSETFGKFQAGMDAAMRTGRLLDVLRFLNSREALRENKGVFMIDRIGAGDDYPGADLVSNWWARNLHIFANMLRTIEPDDRVVLFIGQGHAAILRSFIEDSPAVELVTQEEYLK